MRASLPWSRFGRLPNIDIPFWNRRFQGCTPSPLLFNIVIQLLLDSLEKPAFQPYAYRFSSVQDCSLLSSAYADNVELVTCLPEENQALLDRTEHFLKWTEMMETRPKKCWSLALKRFASRDTNEGESLYRRFNPNPNLSGRPLCYLDDGDFRYLGRPTNAAGCEKTTRNEIKATLERLLQQVDPIHLQALVVPAIYGNETLLVFHSPRPFTNLHE